jgi:hypothetical protein
MSMSHLNDRALTAAALPVLCLLLAGSAEARAQESDQPLAAVQDVRDDEARSARRILHLTGGQTLRCVARREGLLWILESGGERHEFSADQVQRVEREADVLREAKRLRKQAEGLEQRVELSRWMVREGLRTEALRELDSILEERPHHGGALALLRVHPIIGVPSVEVASAELSAAIEALFQWAAQAPVAAREVAILELAKLEEREALHAELLAALSAQSLRRRVFAAQALGRLFAGRDDKRLLQHAVLDTSAAVRRSAAEALANADDVSLIVPVVRALDSDNPRVRAQSAEALGFMAYPAAVEPLIGFMSAALQSSGSDRVPHGYIFVGRQRAYLQDFDVEVATFQAVADPQVNVLLEGDVLEAGVVGVNQFPVSVETSAARGSLRRLTGEDPGHSVRSWERWWEAKGTEWKAAHASPGAEQR